MSTTRADQGTAFRAVLQPAGKTATGIDVPAEVVAALGGGGQPLVRATVGGHTYRSKVAVRGGVHKLPVSAANREAAGIAAGDEVEVVLVLDTEPRELLVPEDLAAALDARPDARRAFESLSYSRRQRLVLGVEDARTEATRQRRIAKTCEDLAAGRPDR
jgi:hypothetical protein